MNWYKQAQSNLILWHATIPKFAEEIAETGFIKPSSQLNGNDYAGWNLPVSGKEYGNLIFLETHKEEAINYADIRLDRLMSGIDLDELLDNEEDYKYVGVFKIIIMNPSSDKLSDLGIAFVNADHREYVYEGIIPKQPNPDIYFEGPEWVERDALWQKHIKQLEQIKEDWKNIANNMQEPPTQSNSRNWYKKTLTSESGSDIIPPMSKEFIIMRGLSGSGKSTLARQLAGDTGQQFAADDYFVDEQGNYNWSGDRVQAAHQWNHGRIKKAIDEGISPVIMDNTNITKWDLKQSKPLIAYAESMGYTVRIEQSNTPWAFDVEELVKKNKHGLDKKKLEKQLGRWVKDPTVDDIKNDFQPPEVNL